ncbi:19360_t:CDS:2, partial [Gigaspora rosea]
MSAIATKIVEKYKLTSKMDISELDAFRIALNLVVNSYQIPYPTPQNFEETIREMVHQIMRDNLSAKLKNLGTSFQIIEATKFPDITKDANEIQRDRRKFVEAFERIDYPDHFTFESVKKRLDKYDISILPDLQALADVMIMLCIRPSELTTLCITDSGVTGHAKNR